MNCNDCIYHTYINDTHFCVSRNHKRKTVRIDNEDSKKDIKCLWVESENRNEKRTHENL
jgi:hypothetical protein